MIIVIGKNSQIGKELIRVTKNKSIIFLSKKQFDICKKKDFKKLTYKKVNIILNFSAYTKVNIKNYNEKKKAFKINVSGLNNLVSFCKKNNIHLIHVSSDYVYKSNKIPKKENFKLKPLNYYAKTKYLGEQLILKSLLKFTIIRTSHLFSTYKPNIASIIIKKLKSNQDLEMYDNIIFNPTSVQSLAYILNRIISKIEKKEINKKLILNFAQFPPITPFKFAQYIKKQLKISESYIKSINYQYGINDDINRPINSTLDVTKINKLLNINEKYWINDLRRTIKKYEL